jgi:hypothetical protein
MNPQEAFLNLLLAAMADAVTGDRISQLKTSIDPDGKGVRMVSFGGRLESSDRPSEGQKQCWRLESRRQRGA